VLNKATIISITVANLYNSFIYAILQNLYLKPLQLKLEQTWDSTS